MDYSWDGALKQENPSALLHYFIQGVPHPALQMWARTKEPTLAGWEATENRMKSAKQLPTRSEATTLSVSFLCLLSSLSRTPELWVPGSQHCSVWVPYRGRGGHALQAAAPQHSGCLSASPPQTAAKAGHSITSPSLLLHLMKNTSSHGRLLLTHG